jgi:hypothetical protein
MAVFALVSNTTLVLIALCDSVLLVYPGKRSRRLSWKQKVHQTILKEFILTPSVLIVDSAILREVSVFVLLGMKATTADGQYAQKVAVVMDNVCLMLKLTPLITTMKGCFNTKSSIGMRTKLNNAYAIEAGGAQIVQCASVLRVRLNQVVTLQTTSMTYKW